MIVVAGPPGSGKSQGFPLRDIGEDFFNADDRAAELHGSYHGIPRELRTQVVNPEMERFIAEHIRAGKSFAIETTLRSPITFEQADEARKKGFFTEMVYMAVDDVNEAITRVANRGDGCGHAAPPEEIRQIYECSLELLPLALSNFNQVSVYDNSEAGGSPRPALVTRNGSVSYFVEDAPKWVRAAVKAARPPVRAKRTKRLPRS